MGAFVLRRLAVSVPLLLATSLLVFGLVTVAGDPLADLRSQDDVAPEVIEARRHALNLDEPVVARYWTWLSGVVRGDFGLSLGGRDVRSLLWERLQVTLRMVLAATLLALLFGVALGVVGAVRQNSAFDRVSRVVMYLLLALPAFWVAGLLKSYLAIRLNRLFGHQVVFTVGEADPNLTGSLSERLANYGGHLLLPTIALVLGPIAVWSRYLRASMLEVLSADYLRAARAKGVPESAVVLRHALRNALVPLTTLVALHFGHLLAGAVIVERVFSWQGMGQMLISGVTTGDANVVMAWLLVTATSVIIFNLLADVAYSWLDPRVRT
ncbi:MAG: ABC transporter permease [Actinomycetota bacterium]|nr:ABC transporter permease [Actinomycetota bacterium]